MISDLQPYEEVIESGYEWLGQVPSHWVQLPGRACYYEKEKNLNVGMKEEKVLSLSYGNIVVKPKEKLRGLVPASFETYQIVEPNDIVIRPTDLQNDWSSLRFGLAATRGIITSAYMCFRTTPHLISEYGHLLLHSYDLKKVFYGLGSGLRQNLDWRDFKYLPCLVPPIEEQKAICRFVKSADKTISELIAGYGLMIGASRSAPDRDSSLLFEYRTRLTVDIVTGKLDVRRAAHNIPDDLFERNCIAGKEPAYDELEEDEA